MQRSLRSPAGFALALILCGICLPLPAAANTTTATGQPPQLQAASAVMIEAETGKVLYSLHPNTPFPPASLAKVMTLMLALDAIDQGKLSWNQEVVPIQPAWDTSMPPRSSLMFLGPNQRLTVKTLLTGLIVDSGNDAAYEIAYLVGGSVPAFAKMMNQKAQAMGLPGMHFVEPSGISSHNRITALEYAKFCRDFVRLYPNALKNIFSVKEFAYPKARNLTDGTSGRPIVQYNRNLLLWDYPGTDGFKTGYIDQAGYNMAVTARRDGMRLIAVVLGVHGNKRSSGIQLRAKEEQKLLNYGFDNFTKIRPTYSPPSPVRVWKGSAGSVAISPYRRPAIVLPKGDESKLTVTVEQSQNVLAPVYAGDTLGQLVFRLAGKKVKEIPLVAESNVSRGGVVTRVFDSIVLILRSILGLSPARAALPPPASLAEVLDSRAFG